ncbi:MAG: oligosaccharide flippase family protein [Betaproteobacteria bacterium]
MTSVRRALAIALAENQITFALQFVTAVIVARLLSPNEIGVYSIAVITLSVAHVVRDFGVVAYLVKEPDLSGEKIRAASAITFAISWALAALVFLASFPVAKFYNEPRLLHLTWVLALNFLMIPFGAVSMAILRRELQMGRIFTIRVGSAFASATTATALAALGFGPMSLAIGNTVNTAVTMLGARIFRPAWLPLMPAARGVRKILTFSGQMLTSDVLLEASRAAPDAILGKVEGPSAVALFGRASGLVDVFARFMSQAMWSVTLPFFSRVKREGGEVGPALTQAQAYFVGVAWPFYAVLAFSAHPVMLTLFGDQWVASIPVLRWMTAFGAATAATMFASTALIAANHAGREVRMTAKVHMLRIGVIATTAPFGIVPLAIGLSGASIVEIIIVTFEIRRTLAISIYALARIYAQAALLTAWSALPALALVLVERMEALRLPGLLALVAASTAAWLSGLFLVRHPLAKEVVTLAGRFGLRRR